MLLLGSNTLGLLLNPSNSTPSFAHQINVPTGESVPQINKIISAIVNSLKLPPRSQKIILASNRSI